MSFSNANPFIDPAPPSVSLTAPTLTGMMVQINYPEILSIAENGYIGKFQEQIRKDYPNNYMEYNLTVGSLDEQRMWDRSPNWRFFDKSYYWRVSRTTMFVAIETRTYSGWADLFDRVVKIAKALSDRVQPNLIARLGVRYVDRVYGELLAKITEIVRPEILGKYLPGAFDRKERTSNEVFATTDIASMISRWGFMPREQSHNIELMPPIKEDSWCLDTDVFENFDSPIEFNEFHFKATLSDFASRAYCFFRRVVNYEFIRIYGRRV